VERDLGKLSGDELLVRCVVTRRERWHRKWGHLTGLAIGAFVGSGIYLLVGRSWLIGVVALFVAIIVLLWLDRRADRRRRPYWNELQRRYTTFDRSGDELVVELKGMGLPHGGHFAIRVRVSGDGGEVEAKSLSQLSLPLEMNDVTYSAGTVALASADVQRVRELIHQMPEGRTEIAAEVLDGMPVELMVRREGAGLGEGECNLLGVPSDMEDHPVVRLARLCCEMSERIPAPEKRTATVA
jgi:hypothetical protein